MNEKNNLTTGSVGKRLVSFALPYLLAAFLQTFYGITDLYVVGRYDNSATVTAVSVGSQVMHMITVIILGLAMGAAVQIGRNVGARDKKGMEDAIGTTLHFFMIASLVLTVLLFLFTGTITSLMMTPREAVGETNSYLRICFLGIPLITACNVISSIFRGMGDSKRPMFFVGAACVVNVVLDFVLVGFFGLGALGAALATVCGQAVSVASAFFVIRKKDAGFSIRGESIRLNKNTLLKILKTGIPIALQDGFIQVAFLLITVIANQRGLSDAAAVGIVEKLIGFMFLVPSAFLSAISAITAQNMGAGKPERARKTLYYGLAITMGWGLFCSIYNQFFPETLVGLFTNPDEADVLLAGSRYLKSYCLDVFFAAIHFCFSGYFCGQGHSGISFVHNLVSIVLVRIPGAYFASMYFPDTLYPMGFAAPAGSLLSAGICICYFAVQAKK